MAITIPPLPELATVTSEPLQQKIRQLLPSQMGFGSDLVAQNVIVPIVDLTATAEGQDYPEYIQTAINFTQANAFNVFNTTTALANTSGFWRFFGVGHINANNATAILAFQITDGLGTKNVWYAQSQSVGTASIQNTAIPFDFVVWLDSGETVNGFSSATGAFLSGSYRQLADSAGNLIYPAGFTPS